MTRVTKLIRAPSGKHIGRLGHQDPGEFPEEVKALFEKAVEYYEENMALMVEIQVSQTPSKFKMSIFVKISNLLIFEFYSNMFKLKSIQTYLFTVFSNICLTFPGPRSPRQSVWQPR